MSSSPFATFTGDRRHLKDKDLRAVLRTVPIDDSSFHESARGASVGAGVRPSKSTPNLRARLPPWHREPPLPPLPPPPPPLPPPLPPSLPTPATAPATPAPARPATAPVPAPTAAPQPVPMTPPMMPRNQSPSPLPSPFLPLSRSPPSASYSREAQFEAALDSLEGRTPKTESASLSEVVTAHLRRFAPTIEKPEVFGDLPNLPPSLLPTVDELSCSGEATSPGLTELSEFSAFRREMNRTRGIVAADDAASLLYEPTRRASSERSSRVGRDSEVGEIGLPLSSRHRTSTDETISRIIRTPYLERTSSELEFLARLRSSDLDEEREEVARVDRLRSNQERGTFGMQHDQDADPTTELEEVAAGRRSCSNEEEERAFLRRLWHNSSVHSSAMVEGLRLTPQEAELEVPRMEHNQRAHSPTTFLGYSPRRLPIPNVWNPPMMGGDVFGRPDTPPTPPLPAIEPTPTTPITPSRPPAQYPGLSLFPAPDPPRPVVAKAPVALHPGYWGENPFEDEEPPSPRYDASGASGVKGVMQGTYNSLKRRLRKLKRK